MANTLLITKETGNYFSFVLNGNTANKVTSIKNDLLAVGEQLHFKTANGANIIKEQFIYPANLTVVSGGTFTFTTVAEVWTKLIEIGFFDWISAGGGSGENFANADLTATGNRVHNFMQYGAQIDSVGYWWTRTQVDTVETNIYHENGQITLQIADDRSTPTMNGIFRLQNSNFGTNAPNGGFEVDLSRHLQRRGRIILTPDSLMIQSDSVKLRNGTRTTSNDVYSPTTSSTSKYKVVLMDSTTGALVTTAPSVVGSSGTVTSVATNNNTGLQR